MSRVYHYQGLLFIAIRVIHGDLGSRWKIYNSILLCSGEIESIQAETSAIEVRFPR